MNEPTKSFGWRTLRLKVRADSYSWFNAAAVEVNQVWNWAAATCADAADRNRRANAKWLSGFDLDKLSSGATEYFEHIGSDTIQRINSQYVQKRRQFKRIKLRWRVSGGTRRSLGWIPFKAVQLRRKGDSLRFSGKTFRVFDREYLADHKLLGGCFAQDACGDWWLCVDVAMQPQNTIAPRESVGIDLGLKTIATTSDGDTLPAGRWTHGMAVKLAMAQRRGHKVRTKHIYRKAARQRADALHKFSRKIVDQYQTIVIGDVSSSRLAKTKMAKSVLDSGWNMLKTQLQYKGQQAGRSVSIVNEAYSTRTCSSCGSLTGPTGLDMLAVRRWICSECGDAHDRDVNAAKNILAGSRCRTSVSGNELLTEKVAA